MKNINRSFSLFFVGIIFTADILFFVIPIFFIKASPYAVYKKFLNSSFYFRVVYFINIIFLTAGKAIAFVGIYNRFKILFIGTKVSF